MFPEIGWGSYEDGCDRYRAWSHFCGTLEGLWFFFFYLLFWLGSSLFMFPILNLGHTYCHSRICNLKLSPWFFICASIYYSCSLHLLDQYRTHRIPAETVDLLSLSIIIMHVQNAQDGRCWTPNLSLTKIPQLWAGLTLKIRNLLPLLRSSILYFPFSQWYDM